MSRYTIDQKFPATSEEIARWEQEASYYAFHPPDPRAPEGSVQATSWGIPPDYLPPKDAVEFVIACFKRDIAEVPFATKLRPEFKFSIVSTCMAHFLWLRTKAGAAWLLRFFGIEEVKPFWSGYAYIYVDPSTKAASQITQDCGLELRIFTRRERDFNPPITEDHDATTEEMQKLLNRYRDPTAVEPAANAAPEMYHWVSEQLRNWFAEPTPNKNWPTQKPNRISGIQWARNLKRSDSVLFYDALDKIELYKDRAYRIKDPNSKDPTGGFFWTGSANMRLIPLPDFYRQGGMAEHQIENLFRCYSCGKMRPCLPTTNDQKLCCSCYGTHIERDERPTLNLCLMRECVACPAHLQSLSDLINLKNRLNRAIPNPIQR
jgi:hypothetical protein